MQDALQRYLDSKKMYHFEGPRGIRHLEQIATEVCGYTPDYSGVMMKFFEDNPGAIEAVVEWIGNQRNADWKDNLESLVGPSEEDEDEVGDLAPPEEGVSPLGQWFADKVDRDSWIEP